MVYMDAWSNYEDLEIVVDSMVDKKKYRRGRIPDSREGDHSLAGLVEGPSIKEVVDAILAALIALYSGD